MEEHICKNNIWSAHQFGLRKGKLTEMAWHYMVDHIEKAIIWKEFALGLFLDIEGAFDNVLFHVIIDTLVKYEFPQYVICWVDSLIRDRMYFS